LYVVVVLAVVHTQYARVSCDKDSPETFTLSGIQRERERNRLCPLQERRFAEGNYRSHQGCQELSTVAALTQSMDRIFFSRLHPELSPPLRTDRSRFSPAYYLLSLLSFHLLSTKRRATTLRARNARLSFAFVYPGPTGKNVVRPVETNARAQLTNKPRDRRAKPETLHAMTFDKLDSNQYDN
jgi:hypothetical protein